MQIYPNSPVQGEHRAAPPSAKSRVCSTQIYQDLASSFPQFDIHICVVRFAASFYLVASKIPDLKDRAGQSSLARTPPEKHNKGRNKVLVPLEIWGKSEDVFARGKEAETTE